MHLFHKTFLAMNTSFDLVLWSNTPKLFDEFYQRIKNEVDALELLLSRYNTVSETYQLNNQKQNIAIPLSQELYNYIALSIELYKKTEGYFDIGCNHKNRENYNLSEIILCLPQSQSVILTQPNFTIDFGGIGKGIALKVVEQQLKNYDIENAFISFGGSSILTRGTHPHGSYWSFSLSDTTVPIEEIKLNNAAVSISGLQNKKGQKTAHILNPDNGQLLHKNAFSVIETDCPIEAEALSTALYVAPTEKHAKIISNFKIKYQKIIHTNY